MAALYVTSQERGSGKTALSAGLAKLLMAPGKKVGFFKPATGKDSDGLFMKELLALSESAEAISPAVRGSSPNTIKTAYGKVAQGKDVVIVEGAAEHYKTAPEIAAALNAKVIVIETYSSQTAKPDAYKPFGQVLLGVIINKVPKSRMEQAQTEAAARLSKAKVNLLGVLPEDRTLLALTIGELAEKIQGEFLSGEEQADELVENLMLGALGLDPGPDYFGRKTDKAVILKSERPDLQLAALQTPLKCLVLSGSTPPNPMVINDAAARQTPIVIAKENVSALVETIEGSLAGAKFSQEHKLPGLIELLEQHLDLKKINQGLGLAK